MKLRLLVLASAVLAAPISAKAPATSATSTTAPAPAVVQTALPLIEVDRGCPSGPEDRKSDLCAQWKAADAAERSAAWGLGAFVIAFATLVAAAIAARWAKKAAIETERSAVAALAAVNEAREANRISADTADKQLRAYLYPSSGDLKLRGQPNSAFCSVKIPLRNTGATPATLIFYDIRVRVSNLLTECTDMSLARPDLIARVKTNMGKIIGPNNETYISVVGRVQAPRFTDGWGTNLHIKTVEFIVEVEWHYRDYQQRVWRVDARFTSENFRWDMKGTHNDTLRQEAATEILTEPSLAPSGEVHPAGNTSLDPASVSRSDAVEVSEDN